MKHLDPTDLPSDPNGSLGNLRTILLRAYNKARTSETTFNLLLRTLRYVVTVMELGLARKKITDDDTKLAASPVEVRNQDTITKTKIKTTTAVTTKPKKSK